MPNNGKILLLISSLSLVTACGRNLASSYDQDNSTELSLEAAKQLIFDEAGVISADVHFDHQEYDRDIGIYEFHFTAQRQEYKYRVQARTGQIIEKQ